MYFEINVEKISTIIYGYLFGKVKHLIIQILCKSATLCINQNFSFILGTLFNVVIKSIIFLKNLFCSVYCDGHRTLDDCCNLYPVLGPPLRTENCHSLHHHLFLTRCIHGHGLQGSGRGHQRNLQGQKRVHKLANLGPTSCGGGVYIVSA